MTVEAILDSTPGPSPWHIRRENPVLRNRDGILVWTEHESKMLLRDSHGTVLLIVDMYCYLRPMEGFKFLIWYQPYPENEIQLLILDADRLKPIPDVDAASEEMNSRKLKVFYSNGCVVSAPMSTVLRENPTLDLPSEFDEFDELFVLASSPSVSPPGICIFVLQPQKNKLEVIPQDWFNNDRDIDVGYQWISKIARDPESGKLVGEGVRLGRFVLDDSFRNIEHWIVKEPFFFPWEQELHS